jgi:hypothetical protein
MLKQVLDWLGGRSRPRPNGARPEPAPPLATMADVEAMIERGGFQRAADIIRARVLPCFNMFANGPVDDALGATRLGGLPDLAAGATWPASSENEPLTFLGQFDLADLARRGGRSDLPGTGLLSAFSGDLQGNAGDAALVRLTPAGTQLVRLPAPAAVMTDFAVLKPVSVRFEPAVSVPASDKLFEQDVGDAAPGCDMDTLMEGSTERPEGRIGQVLGHAGTIMRNMHAAVALDALGGPTRENLLIWRTWEAWEQAKAMKVRPRSRPAYHPWKARDDEAVRWMLANRERIVAETEQWQVLLAIESNHDMDFWVNDANTLFVFIRTDDLKAGDFSRVTATATQS